MTAMNPIMPEQLGRLTLRQLLCFLVDGDPMRSESIKPADLMAREEAEARCWRGEE